MKTPEDVVRAYFAALSSSDLDGIVALFADDSVVMADKLETVAGSAQIRATFEGAFARVRIQEGLHVDRILEGDGLRSGANAVDRTVTLLESGTTIEVTYRELFVLRRASDGWRITDYMFTSPVAAEV